MLIFRNWVATLSAERKAAVALKAGTSVAMLYQLASGHRAASNTLAAKIESASVGAVTRGDMNETCAQCPYFKKCGK